MQDCQAPCLQTDETTVNLSTDNLDNSPPQTAEDLTKDYKSNIAVAFPKTESEKNLMLTKIESAIKNVTGSIIDLDFLRVKVLDTYEAEIMLMDFADLATLDLFTHI